MKRITAFVLFGILFLTGHVCAEPTVLYDGTSVPGQQGWIQTTASTSSGGYTETPNGTTTTFETTLQAINYYTRETGASEFIVSMRVRVEYAYYSPGSHGLGLSVFGDPLKTDAPSDDFLNGLTIGNTEILWTDATGSSYSIDTSVFHEYAMCYRNGNLEVFVDQSYDDILSGAATPVLSRSNVGPPAASFKAGVIGFGDGTNDPWYEPYFNSRYELDFVKFFSLDPAPVSTQVAYIANENDDTVSVVDIETDQIIESIPVGDGPHGVAVSNDGRIVYVTNYNSDSVWAINFSADGTATEITVGDYPLYVSASPVKDEIYVSNYKSDTVSVIDTSLNSVVATISSGSRPYGMGVLPDGGKLYVANAYGASLSVIDTDNRSLIKSVSLGGNPHSVAVHPNGTIAYVTNETSKVVHVIDTDLDTVIGSVPVGNDPKGIAVNHSGTLAYVVNAVDNTVSVIDLGSLSVIDTVTVGLSPAGLGITDDDSKVYVGNEQGASVSVIDTATNQVENVLSVGNYPKCYGRFIGPFPYNVNHGLVAYYPFNGNANDESGNGHNGTGYGAALAADRFSTPDSAYALDGVDDYIDFDPNGWQIDTQNTAYTITGWFKPVANEDGYFVQVATSAGAQYSGPSMFWSAPDNALYFFCGENITRARKTGLALDRWYHFAGVSNPDKTLRLFVDGVEAEPGSFANHVALPVTFFRMGLDNAGRVANGIVDDVRIYDRALSTAELRTLYAQEAPKFFTEIQSVATNGAVDWERFEINGSTYLAVANTHDGTTRSVDSKIYVWNGSQFVFVQSLPTVGVSDLESFTIGGDTFLAVANSEDSSNNTNINSFIYRWNGSQFDVFQTIATHGALGWKWFEIDGVTYLALANSRNGTNYIVDSMIYRWDGTAFAEFQAIPTRGASGWERFQIAGETYLAVPNYKEDYSSAAYPIASVIYKWNGTSFQSVQEITTEGAVDWESFSIGGETYLAVANHYSQGSYSLSSKIYKWNGTAFVEFQSVPTLGAYDWESFTIDNVTYLALANQYDGSGSSGYNIDSTLFKWSGTAFVEFQTFQTNGASDWKHFAINGEPYLALANTSSGTTRNLDSRIYKWGVSADGNHFPNSPATPWPSDSATNISTDATLAWTGGDPDAGDTVTYDVYLGVDSGSLSVVRSRQTALSAPLSALSYNTTYYWQIVARDSSGAQTAGPVWSFTTLCTDCDGDGMPDAWEISRFGDTTTSDGTGDADGDGLTDLQEYQNGTDPVSAEGLVAYYPFNGNAGDESGNGNDGTENNGVSYGQGVSGQAALFDGTDDFIYVWNTAQINSAINTSQGAISLWMKPTGHSVSYPYSYSDGGNNDRLYISITPETSRFILSGLGNDNQSSLSEYKLGEWVNVVKVWENNTHKLYINGEYESSLAFNGGFAFGSPGEFVFGRRGYPADRFFQGMIDEVRIYSRSLSEMEVQQLYENESGFFEEIQAIPTKGGRDWESFIINGEMYLAVANSRDDSTSSTDSSIYRWNGSSFNEIQTLATQEINDWESFAIDGVRYLAGAFESDPSNNYNINSKIYQWNGTSFSEFQAIPTIGAQEWEHFVIDGETYLAVANLRSGLDYTVDSKIYKWNGASFVEFQSISTQAATDVESFVIDGTVYLAVVNCHDQSIDFNIESKIYRWNGSQFVEAQSIPTHGASGIESFTIDSNVYLAIANSQASPTNHDIESHIYKWNGASFELFQGIPTYAAKDWEHFSVNGEHYLAVANNFDNTTYTTISKIYRWNGSGFVEYQSIPTQSGFDWEHFFIDNQLYLAVAHLYDDSAATRLVDSKLYRWKGSVQLVDSDSDTLPDGWEEQYFGNLAHDGTADTDNDGLTDLEEYTHGSNPNLKDTDRDGLLDDFEVANGSDPAVAEGLVAYYPFNGNANDESGNGRHGTEYGASLAADRFSTPDSAYALDGVDDYIDFDPNGWQIDTENTAYTITGWFKPVANEDGYFVQVATSAGAQYSGPSMFWSAPDNALYFFCGENITRAKKTGLALNRWYHFAGVSNPDKTLRLFVDGVEAEPGSFANHVALPVTFFRMGLDNAGRVANGIVDEVRIYDRALSAAELQAIYAQEAPKFFTEFQAIPTHFATDWESFTIEGETYLAVANFKDDSESYNLDTVIYKWNGSAFSAVQTLATVGARDIESFTIDGEAYLAVANKESGSTFLLQSKIFKWNGTSFSEFQAIDTKGANDWESFTVNGETYLAVANCENGSTNHVDSKIYKWNGTSFVEFQSIPTIGAFDWESFTIDGEVYLAVANHKSDDSWAPINSKIYKWNGAIFAELQSIMTSGGHAWDSFEIDGETYLAIANFYDGSSFSIDSKVYKWNGTSFAEYQSIPTIGVIDWESFSLNGTIYIVSAANFNGSTYTQASKIYRWENGSFTEEQAVVTNGVRAWESFQINGVTYLAAANSWDGYHRDIDSIIYKWGIATGGNQNPYLPSAPSPSDAATSISTDATLSWTGGDPDGGDTVTYDVHLGTDSGSLPVVSSNLTALSAPLSALSYDTTYFWQIVARDGSGAQTAGPVWSFTTVCTDCDGDGMPDAWEISQFGDTTASSGTGDADGDGLTDLQEYQNGTDPNLKDTDKDGLGDAFEVGVGSSAVAADGLIAYYPFEDNPNDASGNGHNGTIAGDVISTDGVSGSGYYFDGSGDYITVTPNFSADLTGKPYTWSVWVRTDSLTSTDQEPFFFNDIHQAPSGFCAYRTEDNRLRYVFFVSYGLAVGTEGVEIVGAEFGRWYHLVVRVDETDMRFYVDGQLYQVNPNLHYNDIYSWNGDLAFGGAARLGRYFNGAVDEARVYDRALSDAEIQELFAHSAPTHAQVFQTIPTNWATDWESFTIGGETYLAVASYRNNAASHFVNSVIYKWNGSSFTAVQTLPTVGAWDIESFTIDGETYLAVATYHDGSTGLVQSKIYKWNGAGFSEFQAIDTMGATDWESFTINGEPYLAVANCENSSTLHVDSKIYKWNGTSFVEFQSIPTVGAFDWEAFTIDENVYLAMANSKADGSYGPVNSKIYKWNGASFAEFQSILTVNGHAWKSFEIDGATYLAIANHWDGSAYDVDSKVYKWNGTSFAEYQAIPTIGIWDWESVSIGGTTYLVSASKYTGSTYTQNSKIYRWENGAFVENQSIATTGAQNWESFTIGGEAYLAVANMRDDSNSGEIDSIIYKWGPATETNWSPYPPSAPSPSDAATSISTDVTLSWTGGDPDAGDTVTYDVYLGVDSGQLSVVRSNLTALSAPLSALSYGTTYYWRIVARDGSGLETTGPVWSFTTETPSLTAVLTNTPVSLTNLTTTSVTVGGTGVVSYKYRIDDGGWSPAISVGSTLSLSGFLDGSHTLYVIGSDGAGYWQPDASATTHTWVVDTAVPQITGFVVRDADTENDLVTNSATVAVVFTGVDDQGLPQRWLITETAETPTVAQMNAGSTTAPTGYAIQSAGDGTKTLYGWIMDAANNISPAETWTLTVDTTTQVTVDNGSVCTTADSVILSGTRENGATVSVSCATATVGSVSYPDGPEGSLWQVSIEAIAETTVPHEVAVSAGDAAGNTAATTAAVRRSVPASAAIAKGTGQLDADGTSVLPLTIDVTDGQGSPVCDGTPIEVTTNLGSITPAGYVTQGGLGRVTCDLVASTEIGTATVAAAYAGATIGTETVEMVGGPISRLVFVTMGGDSIAEPYGISVDTPSSYLQIQTQDAFGHAVNVTSDTTLILSSDIGNSVSFTPFGGATTQGDTAITIPAGSNGNLFKFQSSQATGMTLYADEFPSKGWTVGALSVNAYTVDNDPPVTAAIPSSGSYGAPQAVTLSCDDGSGSGCSATYYTTDGSTPSAASSLYTGPITIDKTTTLRFFSVDAAGTPNTETARSETYLIDTVPPVIVIGNPGDGATVGQNFIVSGTAADAGGSGVAKVELQISYNTSQGTWFLTAGDFGLQWVSTDAWLLLSGKEAWSFNSSITSSWNNGKTYTVKARATDITGNLSVPAQRGFTYDARDASAITCNLDKAAMIVGEPLVITGAITPIPSQAVVDIDMVPLAGGAPVQGQVLVNNAGQFSYTAACDDIHRAGEWQITASWDGDPVTYKGAASTVQTLTVQKSETATTLSNPDQSIKTNDSLTISGRIVPQPSCGRDMTTVDDLQIVVEISDDDHNPVQTYTIPGDTNAALDSDGRFMVQIQAGNVFTSPGTYYVQASVAESAAYLGSVSGTGTVTVHESAGYAIIVQGRIQNNEGLPQHGATTDFVYQTLLDRGLLADDIYYLNYDHGAARPDIDAYPSKSALTYAITDWAAGKMAANPANLYIVMVNHGSVNNFNLDATSLTPGELKAMIEGLEAAIAPTSAKGQEIVMILGYCFSGSFVDELSLNDPATERKRVIVTSSAHDEKSYRGAPGSGGEGEYFVGEFFKKAISGATIRECFEYASEQTEMRRIRFGYNSGYPYHDKSDQHPLLDDDGDGKGSNWLKTNGGDGVLSHNLFIGVNTNDANPSQAAIVSVAPTRFLSATASNQTTRLWANVADVSLISEIWLEIMRPNQDELLGEGSSQVYYDLDTYPLANSVDSIYEYYVNTAPANIGGFTDPGMYQIFYAGTDPAAEMTPYTLGLVYKDSVENTLPPEPFDLLAPALQAETPTTVVLDWEDTTDPDGDDLTYTVLLVRAQDYPGLSGQEAFESLLRNGAYDDNAKVLRKELLTYSTCLLEPEDGIVDLSTYYWSVQAIDAYGKIRNSTSVRTFITNNANPVEALMGGHVLSSQSYSPVGGASVAISGITLNAGASGYFLGSLSQTGEGLSATVSAPGYASSVEAVSLAADGQVEQVVFFLTPLNIGDLDGSGDVTLADAIVAVRTLAGTDVSGLLRTDYAASGTDVSGDNMVGMDDLIHILQSLAGMHNP